MGPGIQQCEAGLELGRKLCFLRGPSEENVTCEKRELLVLSVKAGSLSLGPLGA